MRYWSWNSNLHGTRTANVFFNKIKGITFELSSREGTENGRNAKYGKKSEIWNYGICLWEMYKGDYPYHEKGCEFIKGAIKSGIGRYAQEDIQYAPLRDLVVGW